MAKPAALRVLDVRSTGDVYRFGALRVEADDLKRAHGTDERISIESLEQMVAFYRKLLEAL
jgi:carboxypeptidase PM20D1